MLRVKWPTVLPHEDELGTDILRSPGEPFSGARCELSAVTVDGSMAMVRADLSLFGVLSSTLKWTTTRLVEIQMRSCSTST